MFKALSEEFEVTTIDVLGFGCSGRPEFACWTPDRVIGWFEWQLRAWMDETGYDKPEKGKYSMFCHSMGCYFATFWAMKHHESID